MELSDLQQRARAAHGIEIEPAMCAYLQRKLEGGTEEKTPIIGADSRTGVALRLDLPLKSFADQQS